MKLLILIVIAILYIALISTTYSNMKAFEIKNKITYIIFGIIINLLITFIVISLSKINIKNENAYNIIRNIDILIFTAVNGIITMPTIAKHLNNAKMKIIERNKLSKKIIFIIITFFIILIFEGSYLKGLEV